MKLRKDLENPFNHVITYMFNRNIKTISEGYNMENYLLFDHNCIIKGAPKAHFTSIILGSIDNNHYVSHLLKLSSNSNKTQKKGS